MQLQPDLAPEADRADRGAKISRKNAGFGDMRSFTLLCDKGIGKLWPSYRASRRPRPGHFWPRNGRFARFHPGNRAAETRQPQIPQRVDPFPDPPGPGLDRPRRISYNFPTCGEVLFFDKK